MEVIYCACAVARSGVSELHVAGQASWAALSHGAMLTPFRYHMLANPACVQIPNYQHTHAHTHTHTHEYVHTRTSGALTPAPHPPHPTHRHMRICALLFLSAS
jgi:hypothetical protein